VVCCRGPVGFGLGCARFSKWQRGGGLCGGRQTHRRSKGGPGRLALCCTDHSSFPAWFWLVWLSVCVGGGGSGGSSRLNHIAHLSKAIALQGCTDHTYCACSARRCIDRGLLFTLQEATQPPQQIQTDTPQKKSTPPSNLSKAGLRREVRRTPPNFLFTI